MFKIYYSSVFNHFTLIFYDTFQCADDLMEYLEKVENEGKEIDAKELMTNYNLDVICTTGFGIKANCFSDSEDSKLIQMVSKKLQK